MWGLLVLVSLLVGHWRAVQLLAMGKWRPVYLLTVVVLIPHEGVGVLGTIHSTHVVETFKGVVGLADYWHLYKDLF